MPGNAEELAAAHLKRDVAYGPQAVGAVAPFRLTGGRGLLALALSLGLCGIVGEADVLELDERRGVDVALAGGEVDIGVGLVGRFRARAGGSAYAGGLTKRQDLARQLSGVHGGLHGHARIAQIQRQAGRERHVKVQVRQRACLNEHLVGRALERHVAALHDYHAVGLRRLFHIMRDHHDGHPALVQLMAHAHKACSAAGVEHGGSLVEHEHLGVHGQHAGDGDALFLSAGQGVRLMAFEARKPHVLKRLRHAFAQLIGGDAQVLGAEGHIVFHERGYQLVVGVLEHHAHRLADAIRAVGVRGGHVLHLHGALVGDKQGVQVLGQRRLAASVAA